MCLVAEVPPTVDDFGKGRLIGCSLQGIETGLALDRRFTGRAGHKGLRPKARASQLYLVPWRLRHGMQTEADRQVR